MEAKRDMLSRRDFLNETIYSLAGLCGVCGLGSCATGRSAAGKRGDRMRFGLVTYLWAQDWDLPALIGNCEKTQVYGVELRTEHAHGVEASLRAEARKEVKRRFGDSKVKLAGLGTNFDFHHVEPAKVKQNIDGAKKYLVLSHDVGGTGVKVKPNTLPVERPAEQTIEQIGTSLNELGRFGADLGQQVRLEVHGPRTQEVPIIKRIMDVADHPNVTVCWNSNDTDLAGEGLEYNFNLVKDRFGQTAHVRELNTPSYPFQELINLFVGMDYSGWIMLEASSRPADRVAGLGEQRAIFEQMLAKAQGQL